MSLSSGGSDQRVTPSFSWELVAPLVIFLVVNRIGGLRWAVVAATIWSVKVVVDRRRQGLPLGKFMPVITGAVIIRGAIGAVTGSETVYFGLGIASKFIAAAVLLVSVALRRPLAAYGVPYVFDVTEESTRHPLFRSTMAIITAIAGVYYAVSAGFDIWLFRRSSVEGFVLIRFLANWPLSTVAILSALGIANVRLAKVPGMAPLSTLLEQRVAPTTPDDGHTSPPMRDIPPHDH